MVNIYFTRSNLYATIIDVHRISRMG